MQRLEAGQILASPQQARALRRYYGTPVLEAKQLVDVSEVRRRAGLTPYLLESVNPLPWNTAWNKALKVPTEVWEWMREFIPADSACECNGWCQCVAAGAQPFLGNPHQWGFDRHPVVDRQGRLLGARVLPGLGYSQGEIDIVLWPQVCLRVDDRHCYRVDGLVFFRNGRNRCWLVLEFDGGGHDFRRDAYRLARLALPEVRILGAEIKAGQTFQLLLERARQAS